MSDDAADRALRRLALRLTDREIGRAADRIVWRLRRLQATGLFGVDFAHRTLWDEYCHEVQDGPHDLLDSAWDLTLRPFLEDAVARLPRLEAALMTLTLDPATTGDAVIDNDLLATAIRQALNERAGRRDMEPFNR